MIAKDKLAVPTVDSQDGQDSPTLTLGQIGMWIFISTEIMLFAGILAIYLILRLSAMEIGWPRSSIMHASIIAGIVNTVILVFSGVTAWNAVTAAQEDRPMAAKLWLITTLVLGLTFLGIKSHEYYQKYEVGLMPVPGGKQIYEKADLQYLSHVNQRLRSEILKMESQKNANTPFSTEQEERLELLYSLKQNMAEATARNTGRTASPYQAQLCMNLMAWQIFPHPDTDRNLEEVLDPEFQRLRMRLDVNYERLFLVERRQKMVTSQISQLNKELQQFELLGTSDGGAANLESRREWLDVKKKQDQELQVESRRIQSVINPMQGRVDNLTDSFGTEDEILGINERYDFRLPIVVPRGQAWMSVYLLLTGMHALHLIAGLIALMCWLPRKLTADRSPALYVTCMYWQFVDAVWLGIFWFIYF